MDNMTEHQHKWMLPEGGFIVIDTCPPEYPYTCACGAFTHDPETGNPCEICAPDDYRRRTDNLIILSGGELNGKIIAKPVNRTVNFWADGDRCRFLRYAQTENPKIWKFQWNDWVFDVFTERTQDEYDAALTAK